MAQLIPENIIQHIVSFLPYNERVEMNRILPVNCRVVKKLDSDSHNLRVKSKLIKEKLSKIENAGSLTIMKMKYVKQLFLYLLHTRDNVMFHYPKFKAVTIERALHHMDMRVYGYLANTMRQEVKSTIRVATQLLSKLNENEYPIKEDMVGKIVSIA